MTVIPAKVLHHLRWLLLTLDLTTEKCFKIVFEESHFAHAVCLKQLLSRGLGVAIVAGSTLVKLPQVYKIISNGDAAGLSFLGVLLELLAVTASGAYSMNQGFPFSAYGESVFMSFQTSLIAILILWYGGSTVFTLFFSAVYGAAVFAIVRPGLIPEDVLWFGQAANIPMIVVGKLIQAGANFSNGHTGQLSAVTVFLLTLGSLARIFTSIQDTGDPVMIVTFIASSAINVVLALQVIYYWNTTKEVLAKQAKRKKA